MCVPMTMAWLVLRLQLEDRPSIWKVIANIVNKEMRTADKRFSAACRSRDLLTTSQIKNSHIYSTYTCLALH